MLFTYDWHETDLDQMLNFALSRNSRLNGENLESNRSVGQNAPARNQLSEQCSDYRGSSSTSSSLELTNQKV